MQHKAWVSSHLLSPHNSAKACVQTLLCSLSLQPLSAAPSASTATQSWRCSRPLDHTAPRLQARIGRTFNPPSSMTDLSYQMKKIYTTRLLQFEQARGGGVPLCGRGETGVLAMRFSSAACTWQPRNC